MTLYWHGTGPLVKYRRGVLRISDLNPEMATQWRMSRFEMLNFGFRSILAALTGGGHDAVAN